MPKNLPDALKLGPHMRQLVPRQRAFVVALLELGSTNYSQAARAAGYENGSSLRITAHRLAHDEKIIAALNEEGRRRLMASAPMAISELVKMAEDADPLSDKKVKLKAIELILNRTGHHAITESHVEHVHSYTDQEAVRRIFQLAKSLNMDPVKLLGANGIKVSDKGDVIDAEFEEILVDNGNKIPLDEFTSTGEEDDEHSTTGI